MNWPHWVVPLCWSLVVVWLLHYALWPRTSEGKFMSPARAADYYDEHAHHWSDLRKIIVTLMILLAYGLWLLLRRRF